MNPFQRELEACRFKAEKIMMKKQTEKEKLALSDIFEIICQRFLRVKHQNFIKINI